MPEDVRFDLTIFNTDGDSPVWGSATGYVISDASFSTLSSHDRPYLQVPENFLASKTDFLKGSSDIGGVSVRLLDVPTTSTDQTTGIVTSQITELAGAEAILRRWYDSLSAWRTIFRGRVKAVEVAGDTLVEYVLHLEDGRAFEERDLLFEINETFSLYPQPGPIADYGQFPAGDGYLIPAAAVAYTRFRRIDFGSSNSKFSGGVRFTGSSAAESSGGIYYGGFDFDRDGDWNPNDFSVGDETLASPYEVFQERIDKLKKVCDSDPTGIAIPASATTAVAAFGETRLAVFRGFTIRWRLDDQGDWNYIRDHPVPPQFSFANAVLKAEREEAVLYASSFDPDDLPPYDTAIEMQVLARYTTSDTPYFWDNGTVGDLLYDISQGLLTREVPRETYEASSLATFRTSTPAARFIETSPQNRRRWAQRNGYQAALYAPCLTQSYEIRPVAWAAPDDLVSAPFLAQASMQPVGDWRQEASVAFNTIEGRVVVENIRSQEFITRQRQTWYRGIDESELNPNLSAWERYEATETQLLLRDEAAVAKVGPRTVEYAPNTLRAIGEVEGRTVGGDTEDTGAGLIANQYLETAQTRWIPDGAPRFSVPCLMSDTVVRDAEVGDWLRVEAPWLPDRSTKLRNAVRYMQVFGITDAEPHLRTLHLEDGGIPGFSDDDTDDPENPTTDCLDNGTTEATSASVSSIDGRKMLVFSEAGTYDLHNDCGADIEVEVLLIAGAGGGGGGDSGTTVGSTPSVGGGGAAGGVFGAYGTDDRIDSTPDPETVTIKAGATVPVTIGAGGAAGSHIGPTRGSDGGDTIIWVNADGDALDPMVHTPVYYACGGAGGGAGLNGTANAGGGAGGSGSGAGARGHAGASGWGRGLAACDQSAPGAGDQGEGGGGSFSTTGFTNCATARSGSGGAFGSAGTDGTGALGSAGAPGGNGRTLTNWNNFLTGAGGGGAFARIAVVGGGCASGTVPDVTLVQGAPGTGGDFGAGGNGGINGDAPATAGTQGLAVFRYIGAAASLTAPTASVATPSEDNTRRCVTVSSANWLAVPPPDYRVRVEYAVSSSEPATNSGLWTVAGFLTAAGTICTPSLPTGATVWTRVIAESSAAPPSTPSTPASGSTASTAGLLNFELTRLGDTLTATFTPNSACEGVRFYGYIAPEGTAYDSDDQAELAEVDADSGTYTVPQTITQGEVYHLVAECLDSLGDPGNTLVRSRTYATPRVAKRSDITDVLDRLAFDDNFNIMLDDNFNPTYSD